MVTPRNVKLLTISHSEPPMVMGRWEWDAWILLTSLTSCFVLEAFRVRLLICNVGPRKMSSEGQNSLVEDTTINIHTHKKQHLRFKISHWQVRFFYLFVYTPKSIYIRNWHLAGVNFMPCLVPTMNVTGQLTLIPRHEGLLIWANAVYGYHEQFAGK